MTRDAVFMLLVCSGLAPGRVLTTNAIVALVPHFERRLGPHVLQGIAPMIAEVFRQAGLSLEWYKDRDTAPTNAARTLDVWFQGDCRPMTAREFWGSPLESARLGWVHWQDGQIAEDIVVDCTLVMQLAAEARSPTTNGALLEVVFLRLIERVLAHELLHALLMSPRHGSSEFSRPRMRSSDWRRIGRLTHAEVQALRQLYGPDASVAFTQNP